MTDVHRRRARRWVVPLAGVLAVVVFARQLAMLAVIVAFAMLVWFAIRAVDDWCRL